MHSAGSDNLLKCKSSGLSRQHDESAVDDSWHVYATLWHENLKTRLDENRFCPIWTGFL